MSRLRSDIWVAAFMRQAQVDGHFATVLAKGAEEAGAIAVVVLRADRKAALFLPAAQSEFSDAKPVERRFRAAFADVFVEEADVTARLERERRFDADLWVVELESRDGSHGLLLS